MTIAAINGIELSYEDSGGAGDPVVLVMGTGAGGRAWHLHQVPALLDAGFRVITYDHRGIAPTSGGADSFTIDDLAADLYGLIRHLGLPRTRLAGTSMGSYVIQELALTHPEVIEQAVLLATRGRCDTVRTAMSVAERELYDAGIRLPARFDAVLQALWNLSPRTLDDPVQAADWLDLLEATSGTTAGVRVQMGLDPIPERLTAYRQIRVPCRVVAFADDLITPVHLGREVAAAIPGAEFEIIAGCGHFGYLEDPGAVNKSLVEFFRYL